MGSCAPKAPLAVGLPPGAWLVAAGLVAGLALAATGCRDCAPPAPGPPTAKPAPTPTAAAPTSTEPGATAGAASTPAPTPAPKVEEYVEEFSAEVLDPQRWQATRLNDFQEARWDLQPDPEEPGDGRLRLRAATLNTRDATVKHMGVVLTRPLDLRSPVDVQVDLDWAHQRNGSYLALAAYLAPAFDRTSVTQTPDWLGVRVVGEPPGQTARLEVMRRSHGNLAALERFGWPGTKPGRDMGRVRLELHLDGRAARLNVDGKERFSTPDAGHRYEQAFLYLELTSHSNYPGRDVFVDRVAIRAAFGDQPTTAAPLPGAPPPAQRPPGPAPPSDGAPPDAAPSPAPSAP